MIQIVNYVADENGYKASVTYEGEPSYPSPDAYGNLQPLDGTGKMHNALLRKRNQKKLKKRSNLILQYTVFSIDGAICNLCKNIFTIFCRHRPVGS